MKVTIDFPEWTDERNIDIFAGIEHAIKRENGVWYVKDRRCNLCGQCCMNVPEDWPHGYNKETGNCIHLEYNTTAEFEGETYKQYLCDLCADRNFSCSRSEGEPEFCSIIWNKIE
jgi:Fe-S-cluster-containing hydrogenase component 2